MAVSHQRIDFSIFVTSETPIGATNCTNQDYETNFDFIPTSLEVFLDGVKIDNNSIGITGANTFSLIDITPQDTEKVTVNYIKNLC